MSSPKWETKPLESMNKALDMRARHLAETFGREKKKGEVYRLSSGNFMQLLTASLDDARVIETTSLSHDFMQNQSLALRSFEVAEGMGYGPSFCSSAKGYCGLMVLDVDPWGGKFPRPDFVLQINICAAQGKSAQHAAEHYGVPYFCIDVPVPAHTDDMERHIRYLQDQQQDAIEWMQKVTGKRFDEEKLIAGATYEWKCSVLWSKVCELQKAIPAPVPKAAMDAISFMLAVERHTPECVELCQMAFDEVTERVEKRIAGLASERFRMVHEGMFPYYYRGMFQHAKELGVAWIGSYYNCAYPGAWELRSDGRLVVAKSPEERGNPIRTKEDALRARAELYLSNPFFNAFNVVSKASYVVQHAREWHADAVVLHVDRGCPGIAAGVFESKLALRENSIPAFAYESNWADSRQFDEAQVTRGYRSFLETLGLYQN